MGKTLKLGAVSLFAMNLCVAPTALAGTKVHTPDDIFINNVFVDGNKVTKIIGINFNTFCNPSSINALEVTVNTSEIGEARIPLEIVELSLTSNLIEVTATNQPLADGNYRMVVRCNNPADLDSDSDDADIFDDAFEFAHGDIFDFTIGAIGPQGIQGKIGPQGDKGAKGAQGAQGKGGAQGAQGKGGAAGAKGDKGDTGAGGAQGAQGKAGGDGAAGATGPAGPSKGAITRLVSVAKNCIKPSNHPQGLDFINCIAKCPAGHILLSGGYRASENTEVLRLITNPTNFVSGTTVVHPLSNPPKQFEILTRTNRGRQDLTVIAYCAKLSP